METFVDIISDIGAQISKIKRCRINQQTLNKEPLTTRALFSPIFMCVLTKMDAMRISSHFPNAALMG